MKITNLLNIFRGCHIILFCGFSLSVFAQTNYKGRAFQNKPIEIPAKVQCEFYDLGGEGIAYHDNDSINQGSGKLNPANATFLNEFRMNEGVDISYTKPNGTDDNPFNIVSPEMGQLYVGWSNPGEWMNYTLNVCKTGIYTIGIMYSANGEGGISFELDAEKLTPVLKIPSTNNTNEPLDWRQWHHWSKINDLTKVHLTKGIHVLKLNTVINGNMNYDYLDFKLM